jgi:hypothetical protein
MCATCCQSTVLVLDMCGGGCFGAGLVASPWCSTGRCALEWLAQSVRHPTVMGIGSRYGSALEHQVNRLQCMRGMSSPCLSFNRIRPGGQHASTWPMPMWAATAITTSVMAGNRENLSHGRIRTDRRTPFSTAISHNGAPWLLAEKVLGNVVPEVGLEPTRYL